MAEPLETDANDLAFSQIIKQLSQARAQVRDQGEGEDDSSSGDDVLPPWLEESRQLTAEMRSILDEARHSFLSGVNQPPKNLTTRDRVMALVAATDIVADAREHLAVADALSLIVAIGGGDQAGPLTRVADYYRERARRYVAQARGDAPRGERADQD